MTTRKHHLKRRHSTLVSRDSASEAAVGLGVPPVSAHEGSTLPSIPSVSTSYSVKPFSSVENNDLKTLNTNQPIAARKTNAATYTDFAAQRSQHEGLTYTAITCMSLLALQFGIQPILVRKFTPPTIVRSSVVLVQELVKFGIAGGIYLSGTEKAAREKDFEGELRITCLYAS